MSTTFNESLAAHGRRITSLVVEKNRAYGDAANKVSSILSILYPEGITSDKMQDALLIVRVLDKIVRIAQGNKKAFSESPWQDIAGYGIIGMAVDGQTEEENSSANTQ